MSNRHHDDAPASAPSAPLTFGAPGLTWGEAGVVFPRSDEPSAHEPDDTTHEQGA